MKKRWKILIAVVALRARGRLPIPRTVRLTELRALMVNLASESQWRRMDRRVQALVEWLAKPPGRRPATIES